jgi:hypothetical protein
MKRLKTALRVARAEWKTNAVWPDWAIKAKAAGWTPPANWKP